MPGLSGLELLKTIQSDPSTQKIPVILLTAKSSPSDRAHFAQLGVAGTIYKPFNPLDLVRQVAQVLGWA